MPNQTSTDAVGLTVARWAALGAIRIRSQPSDRVRRPAALAVWAVPARVGRPLHHVKNGR
jgi:hypothetical protein